MEGERVDSWKRPKLKIPRTKDEWIWDVIGYSFFIGAIIMLVIVWSDLPQKVPAHYNARGEVDRWGSKWELIILPMIGAFIGMMMQVFEKYPEWHNYPERFNESNAAQFYLHSRKLINQVKNICLMIFALILFESVSISLNWWSGFGIWLLPLLLLAVFIPIGIGIYKQKQIK